MIKYKNRIKNKPKKIYYNYQKNLFKNHNNIKMKMLFLYKEDLALEKALSLKNYSMI